MRTRVIGLGNTILTDDGVGICAASELRSRLIETGRAAQVDIVETEVAGFALIELMAGWDRVILIDSVQFGGVKPGTVHQIRPDDLHTSLRLRSIHEIDLPTGLELGRRLGIEMPREILIFCIQAQDAATLGESLSPNVKAGMSEAVDLVLRKLEADSG